MADPSGSIALPSETATFSRTSSTKLSLRVVVPPAINTSFSRTSPTKPIPSDVLPTKLSPNSAHIIASSPCSGLTELSPTATIPPFSSTSSSLGSTPTELSPTDALPPSTSSPNELSPTDALPPLSNAILSPRTNSASNTTPIELSPINPLPPLSPITLFSPSTTSPAALPHSPSTTSGIAELSPITALPPSTTSPAALPHSPSTTSGPAELSSITVLPSSTTSPAALLPSPSTATSYSSDITIDVSDLQCCIDDVMSALIEKGHKCRFVDRGHKLKEKSRLVESGNKLKDTVQHVSSDFSKVFGGISEGADIIFDQKSCPNMFHTQGPSVATELIKDVSNIHWAAIGLLVIANVLERFDKISVNDRDCFDLLKAMLDLAKILKQLKDNSFDLHKEIAVKMVDALWLISNGAKKCRSFIAHRKISKFFFTTKIRDDLEYMRRKMDSTIVQLSLQIQIKDASFNNSRRQAHSDRSAVDSMLEPSGLHPEESTPTNETIHGGLPSEQSTTTTEYVHSGGRSSEQSTTTTGEIVQCEAEDAAHTETSAPDSRIDMCTTNPNIVSRVNGGDSDEAVPCKETDKVNRPKKSKRPFFRLPAYLKKLKERRSQRQKTQIKQKPAKKVVLGISLDKRELCSFSIEDGCGGIPTICFTLEELHNATNGFEHQIKSSHARFNLFKGTLPSGRQVTVRTFPSQEASSSEQESMKIMLNELGCMLRLQHKNIVKLVGFCNIEKEEPMLVYDYPPNGNLCDFLSGDCTEGKGKGKGDSKKKKVLDWSERSKILLGIISALIYLHEAADDHKFWVHTDIKPENILLDGNFNAKLSDFSLAKAKDFDDSSSGDGRILSSELEVDIYSFGILALQVISGRQYESEALKLRMRAWKLSKKNHLQELIDPELLKREGCEFRSILRSIKIGLWCTITDPSLRPKASKVSAVLSTEEEIPPLPDDCILMKPHSDESPQSPVSDDSVRAVEGGPSEVWIEKIEEPRA